MVKTIKRNELQPGKVSVTVSVQKDIVRSLITEAGKLFRTFIILTKKERYTFSNHNDISS